MTSINGLHGNQTLANVTALPYSTNPAYVVPWGWVALYAITMLIIIAGNGLVIIAVFRYQFLQTLTNTFVVGVAAIDLSSSSTGWMKIADLIWPNSMAGYGPCLIRLTLGSISGVGSASLLLCKLFVGMGILKSPNYFTNYSKYRLAGKDYSQKYVLKWIALFQL